MGLLDWVFLSRNKNYRYIKKSLKEIYDCHMTSIMTDMRESIKIDDDFCWKIHSFINIFYVYKDKIMIIKLFQFFSK